MKIALVGCGGRGRGAAVNALKGQEQRQAGGPGDAFQDSLDVTLKQVSKACPDQVDVPQERMFLGWTVIRRRLTATSTWCCCARRPVFGPRSLRPR